MIDRVFYSLAKPLLFSLDAERAHDITLANLGAIAKNGFLLKKLQRLYGARVPSLKTKCMGIDFEHPLGLAAGLDKDARAFNSFAALGFSGVEMGTVTPKPQPGNPKPRIFRLIEDRALINRLGFNSQGLDVFLQNFSEGKHPLVAHAVAGINIGKNATTDINDAQFDYVAALQRVYAKADYVTVNISSPNTSSLRDLQNANYLDDLLLQIKQARDKCAKVHKREVPVALKVAPDLEDVEIETIAELVMSHRLDAVIATNTTTARPSTLQSSHAAEPGGLSGQPVKDASTQVIKKFYQQLQGRVSIIGVGGIATPDDAWEKLLAGADYLQVYSMFIYEGPLMIRNIVEGLKSKVERAGYTSLQEALSELRTRA